MLDLAVLGELLVPTRSGFLCVGGEGLLSEPADAALPGLRRGRMTDLLWDWDLDIRGKSANSISSEENTQCLDCTVDLEQLRVVNEKELVPYIYFIWL